MRALTTNVFMFQIRNISDTSSLEQRMQLIAPSVHKSVTSHCAPFDVHHVRCVVAQHDLGPFIVREGGVHGNEASLKLSDSV